MQSAVFWTGTASIHMLIQRLLASRKSVGYIQWVLIALSEDILIDMPCRGWATAGQRLEDPFVFELAMKWIGNENLIQAGLNDKLSQ